MDSSHLQRLLRIVQTKAMMAIYNTLHKDNFLNANAYDCRESTLIFRASPEFMPLAATNVQRLHPPVNYLYTTATTTCRMNTFFPSRSYPWKTSGSPTRSHTRRTKVASAAPAFSRAARRRLWMTRAAFAKDEVVFIDARRAGGAWGDAHCKALLEIVCPLRHH